VLPAEPTRTPERSSSLSVHPEGDSMVVIVLGGLAALLIGIMVDEP
jgi:hypothetical protein